MIAALCVVFGVAEAAAWAFVAGRRVSVWAGLGPALAVAGVAALASGRVELSPRVAPAGSAAVGAGAGLALYAGTRAFVAVAGPWWPAFRRQAGEIYGQRGSFSVRTTVALALVVVAGEELFWRGLVQPAVGGSAGRPAGAAIAWLAYVAANAPSRNLPILAAAAVGGAAWAALALWTGGVLAPLACHGVWTGLMIALPPAGEPSPTEGAGSP